MRPSIPLAIVATLAAPAAGAQVPCAGWEITPVPADPSWTHASLNDVSALSSNDAWAVGYRRVKKASGFGSEEFSFAVHWDGATWTEVPTPSPSPYPGGTDVELNAVEMIASNDVWAAGSRYGDAGGLSVGDWIFLIHWDGATWSEVPFPPPNGNNFSGTRVEEIVAFGPKDVWFGGWWGESNAQASVTWRPLVMHWDGAGLKVHDGPAPFDAGYAFHSVSMSATAPNDLWAACAKNTAGGDSVKGVVLHWDGSTWSQANVPDASYSWTAREVVARAPNDVWVFGTVPFSTTAHVIHFDGSSWKQVATGPFAQAATALGGTIYAGASAISIYDGASPATVIETFPSVTSPAVFGMDSFDPCAVWAVGSHYDPNDGIRPFAARMDASGGVWATVGDGVPGVGGVVPTLSGTGALAGGTPMQIALGQALPGASSTLIVGAAQADLPLFAGTLVPTPSILLSGLPVGPNGGWVIGATWPHGVPSGAELFLQAWIPDPFAPQRYAATPGLRARAP